MEDVYTMQLKMQLLASSWVIQVGAVRVSILLVIGGSARKFGGSGQVRSGHRKSICGHLWANSDRYFQQERKWTGRLRSVSCWAKTSHSTERQLAVTVICIFISPEADSQKTSKQKTKMNT